MKRLLPIVILSLFISCSTPTEQTATDNPYAKDMAWWSQARYGMFLHWGISTLEGFEISWPRNGYGPEKYDRLAMRFNPKDFDADKWIDVAENGGMKYMVLTAKHHDGYCLWDSKANPHNIMNSPYGKDICKQLADAAHRRGMRLGWYFSVREWQDSTCSAEGLNHIYVQKMKDELTELLTNYGKIDLLWFDYEGNASPADPQEIFDLCRSLQPEIVINNRLYSIHGNESCCYVGKVGMYATPEQFVGGYGEVPWETCSTSSTSRQWSIRYNDPPRPKDDLIWELISSAGGNGNLLMNVGPDSLGVIGDDYAKALAEVGNWIKANDGVLYSTIAGPWRPTGEYVATRSGKYINIIEKTGHDIALPYTDEVKFHKAYLLQSGKKVESTVVGDTIKFIIPTEEKGTANLVIRLETDNDAANIGTILPFSTSHSLAYGKSAKASSSLSDTYMYCPASAFDDNYGTLWMTGRRKDFDSTAVYGHLVHMCTPEADACFYNEGWLEVDLEYKTKITSYKILPGDPKGYYELQYKDSGDNWVTVASNNGGIAEWIGTIDPVEARFWRVTMKDGVAHGGIREFQLF